LYQTARIAYTFPVGDKKNNMKPGTYTQQYVHIVFAVKNREAALRKEIREQVFGYIGGILTQLRHKVIIVNGVSDHIHILIGLHPDVSVSDTVYAVKRSSSLFINQEKLCRKRFSWQSGFGSFTYSRSQIDRVFHYIKNQEQHHERATFRKEYIRFLEKNAIEYDTRFLFQFWEDD
jgi:REP element-mobilizing transposase RayT